MIRKLARLILKDPKERLANKAPAKNSLSLVDQKDRIQPVKPRAWREDRQEPTMQELKLRSVNDFPVYNKLAGEWTKKDQRAVMDSSEKLSKEGNFVLDDANGDGTMMIKNQLGGVVPMLVQDWYMRQSFIGYQACGIIAQHWLVNKACSMSGEDALRNGWTLKTRNGENLTQDQKSLIIESDKELKIKSKLTEFIRFKNIFGIRIAIFHVKSDDPDYYEKPFNIDGIKPGSYMGISQPDPYYCMPVMNSQSANDPASIHYFEPEFWKISGTVYHRSHLIIIRGPEPMDILKPSYIFGGISLVQQIYERCYAAERTANESPLLAASKRTSIIHADLDRVAADEEGFVEKILRWVSFRDNHGVKVLGIDEAYEQADTSLADLDSVIMNQYQLVAAIAKTPATKILGTPPKGFNATGEFESVSYHEELESIQEHYALPLLERHYAIQLRSLEIQVQVEPIFNEVDSVSAQTRATINLTKAQTAGQLIQNGTLSPADDLTRLQDDEHSGYPNLSDGEDEGGEANETPGMSPEAIAKLQQAGAAQTKAEATNTEASAGAIATKPGEGQNPPQNPNAEPTEDNPIGADPASATIAIQALLSALAKQPVQANPDAQAATNALAALLAVAMQSQTPGGTNNDGPMRGTKQGVKSINPTVRGVNSTVDGGKDGV